MRRWDGALPVAVRVVVALVGMVVFASGCGRPRPVDLDRVRVAMHGDPISLDPHLQNEMLTFAELLNVYEGLTGFDPQLVVEPRLAASWESPDELTWLFHLRPGVRFHDGALLTAADVVASLERAQRHPRSNLGPYLVEIASVRAIGADVVEVRTARPFPILLNKLVYVAILPAARAAAGGDGPGWLPDEITAPVGTGPYRFREFSRGAHLLLERFEGYWQPPTGPRELEFLPLGGREGVDQLLAGKVELVRDVPYELAPTLVGKPGCRLESLLGLRVAYLHLSPASPPFDDVRVRRAVDLALDREALAAGRGRPASQMVSPNTFGYDPGLAPTVRDVKAARELLAAAGHPDGVDVVLEMRQGRQATKIVAQLAGAGIHATAAISPMATIFERLRNGAVPFYYGGVLAPSADASDVLDSFVHTSEPARSYGASNFPRYSNPELDRLIERIGATAAMTERRNLLQQALRQLGDDAVFLPLVVENEVYLLSPSITWQPRLDSLVMGRTIRPAGRLAG
jgi:peptide/nickel transport system substrate-binding protein